MHYYKIVEDGIITQIGSGSKETTMFTPIAQEEHERLSEIMASKPDDTLEQKYVLSAETETYKPIPTTHEDKVRWYFNAVTSEQMVIEDVPEEFRSEVEAMLPNNPYGIPNEEWLKIQMGVEQQVINSIAKEVSSS